NLWIGTYGGLNKLSSEYISGINKNKSPPSFISYIHDPEDPNSLSDNRIYSILEDQSGNLWIGTVDGGLNRLLPGSLNGDKKSSPIFKHYRHLPDDPASLSADRVFSIYEDSHGTLWIGTWGGGLNKLLLTENLGESENSNSDVTFIHYKNDPDDPNTLSDNEVPSIYEDNKGILWIGTHGGGLNKFDSENETFTHYTDTDGLSSSVVLGILEDDGGNLWLSTIKGLNKFDPENKTFSHFDVRDGLVGNEFSLGVYKSKNGEMFFGGITGFNSFFPENIKDNKYIPPIVITSFQKFNKPVHFNHPVYEIQEIDLSYKDYVFSFEFSALDYAASEKNEYAYKMEGLDDDWIYTDSKRRFATYTTLSPGEYLFRVKGTNSDGIWNEEGASIRIILTPPFWQTWWFRTIIIFSILLTAFSFYKRRINKIEEKERNLAERLNEKTKAATALQNALSEVENLKNRLVAENIYLQDEIKLQHNFENIITQSEALKKLLYKVEQVASTDATVLILGESGTGKELFTRAIHNISDRGERPLVKVNCSALPANLIESELFGHEKGAFTGATSRKIGRFELADGGTIFLD
ncbi:MAG: sigma 54-interacting transcriptional regulator, partial [Cyclobacteriaceae bacterium]|nr:sigma 54-interacting transcriptional regulator [Cyclobacteriaceae bacterium]